MDHCTKQEIKYTTYYVHVHSCDTLYILHVIAVVFAVACSCLSC